MRVLEIGNMYPPHHLGGYELVWRSSVEHLRGRGHEVRVLTTDYQAEGVDPAAEDEDVHRELRWFWRDHRFPRIGIGARLRLERHNAAVLARHLEGLRPDVVGWWSMGGMSLSLIEQVRRRGIPAAGFVCDEWMLYGPWVDAWSRLTRRPPLSGVAERLTGIPARVRLADCARWLFPSETLRRRSTEAAGLAGSRVAHQGVDRHLFAPAERPPWRSRLLYVGRIDARKGTDLAILALCHLDEAASLEVVGSGDNSYMSELIRAVDLERLQERVSFTPRLSQAELRDRYAGADALVFPVRWQEPWGLVPFEAMAVGVPVIASGRGGSAEFLRDGENCLIFDPDGGPQALAAAVRRLAEQPELRARLREGGFRTAGAIEPDSFNAAVESELIAAIGSPR